MQALNYLSYSDQTAKRVEWESWEFTVVGPKQVTVTNASFGYLKGEHEYVVTVEDRDGVPVPAKCECPADSHQNGACKHRLALATVGGPTVLNAALAFEEPFRADNSDGESEAVVMDGGLPAVSDSGEDEECEECAQLSNLPCWSCYRDGKRELEA